MRLHNRLFFPLAIMISIFQSWPCLSADFCSRIDISTISAMAGVDLTKALIVSKTQIQDPDLCQVILKIPGRYVPCYVSDNSVILGHLYREGQNISQHGISEIKKSVFAAKMAELDKIAAFSYRPSVGPVGKKRTLYLITDPLCPYCHEIEPQLRDMADKHNLQVNLILYSVHGSHGTEKCIEAVCRNFSFNDYINDGWRKKDPEEYGCDKGRLLIENTIKTASEIGIESVPMFILDDGRSVAGADLTALEMLVSQERLIESGLNGRNLNAEGGK
jgi:thiol:disulfide interchange protein DsbC